MTSIDPAAAAFGRRLQQARKRTTYTQTGAAAELSDRGFKSAGKATVSAWEVGRGLPSPLVLRALCRLYGCTADSVLWESPAEVPGAAAAMPPDLAQRIAALDEPKRQSVWAVLRAALDAISPPAPKPVAAVPARAPAQVSRAQNGR